ncbi:MAG: PrsW family glutamic-type intramembrane protease [Anaerolineae bacterium]
MMRRLIQIVAVACGVMAAVTGTGLGVVLLLVALLGGFAPGPMGAGPQLPVVALAVGLMAISAGLGLVLAWSGWRSLAGAPARPWQWPAWGWWLLAFVAVVGTGQAAFQAGLILFMPLAHLGASTLAALGVLALALSSAGRYVRLPSARAAAGSLAWGGLGSVSLALVAETALAVVGLLILTVWLNATQPELVASLQAWAEQLQEITRGGPQPLVPPPEVALWLFRSPGVMLAIVGFVGVLVPLIEEIAKGLAVPLLALTGRQLRPIDGFLLGAAAGAGLALVEGVFNGALGLMVPQAWAGAMFLRAAASTMHCAASGLVGLAWVLLIGRRWLAGIGLGVLGFMLHAAWNAATMGTAALTLIATAGGPGLPAGSNLLSLLFIGTLLLLWLLALVALAWLPRRLARIEAS